MRERENSETLLERQAEILVKGTVLVVSDEGILESNVQLNN